MLYHVHRIRSSGRIRSFSWVVSLSKELCELKYFLVKYIKLYSGWRLKNIYEIYRFQLKIAFILNLKCLTYPKKVKLNKCSTAGSEILYLNSMRKKIVTNQTKFVESWLKKSVVCSFFFIYNLVVFVPLVLWTILQLLGKNILL